MNITEIVEKMDGFTDEQRLKYLTFVAGKFCKVSNASLQKFQFCWDGNRPWEEFAMEQNKVIRECIACENTSVGEDIRKIQGLEKWDMNWEIGEDNGEK